MPEQHTPWCDHQHPDTADGTGATPCFSPIVALWPGATAVLRSPIYPADRPTVIVDNPNGTQTEWSVTDFRGMLYRGIDLVVAATSPIPDASGQKAIDRINADAQPRRPDAGAFAQRGTSRDPYSTFSIFISPPWSVTFNVARQMWRDELAEAGGTTAGELDLDLAIERVDAAGSRSAGWIVRGRAHRIRHEFQRARAGEAGPLLTWCVVCRGQEADHAVEGAKKTVYRPTPDPEAFVRAQEHALTVCDGTCLIDPGANCPNPDRAR